MRVIFADFFDDILENCDEQTQNAVDEFVFHVKKYGLKKLKGRNKSSAVPSTTKKGIARYKFAQKHCLWHYHLGVPEYVEQSVGDFTSEMIVHYIRFDAFIVLIDIDKHPPFVLPTIEKLSYQS